MRPSRVAGRVTFAAVAWGTAIALVTGSWAPRAAVADTSSPDSSAVTVSGTGEFASLKISVNQTAGLIDQVVHVTWTGATPTQTGFMADYLQIMQCWGDDPAGPTREHCEFGNSADTRGGPQVTTRQLNAGSTFTDPAETQVATADNPYNYVPFESSTWVDDPASPGHQIHPTVLGNRQDLGKFFDAQSTNELPLNATGVDGTGEAFFETMTAEEAPGLGCGGVSSGPDGQPRTPKCWMVIVPRGETEVNGQPSTDNGAGLVSSPLSQTNWDQRIVIPLQFTPIGLSCPIGSPEQRTSGQEVAAEAVYRWQAALCNQSGTVYSYSKASDDAARRQLLSRSPGLDFITNPVPASNPAAGGISYSPVAVSAGVIAFNVDFRSFGGIALRAKSGQRVPAINLTPRLVAKLITESYQLGAPPNDPALTAAANPSAVLGLTYDPDFYAANPDLVGLNSGGGDILMPFAPSDLIQELWTWIDGDPAAKAFLDGAPDPWGMTVNPSFLKLTDAGPPNGFPKQDPYCAPQSIDNTGSQPPDLCTLDVRPYANDMHDAARSAARGDTLSRAQWDSTPPQPHYKKVPLQISGQESVMAFTDAATAARYSLPVARLINSSGSFVAPTTTSLAAGVASMTASGVPGVMSANPRSTDPAAYPLTSITYAATVPSMLTSTARANYADFIQYAVTAGQQPGFDVGQLPIGYAPLTPALVTLALTAEISLRNYVSPAAPTPTPTAISSTHPAGQTPTATKKPTPTKAPVKTKSPAPRTTPSSPSASTTAAYIAPPAAAPVTSSFPAPLPATTSPVTSPAPVSPPGTTVAPAASTAASTAVLQPVAESRPTPAVAAGSARYALIVVLGLGGLCALSGPTLLRLGRRRPE
jgi:hypothetical protein